jgi:hypothetical protein
MRMQAMLALWIETSRGATANAVDASYASSRGLLWGATLRLSDEGPVSVEVSCDGQLTPPPVQVA